MSPSPRIHPRGVVRAALVGVLVLLGAPMAAVDAGERPLSTLSGDSTCDTETGTYVITFTIESLADPGTDPALVVGPYTYYVDGVQQPVETWPQFSPDMISAGEVSTATAVVPGTATQVNIAMTTQGPGGLTQLTLQVDLDGDCAVAPVTTTTTTPTESPSSTTTTPRADVVPTRPDFTG